MLSRKLRRRLLTVAVFILPVVLVKVTGALLGGGPVEARATTGDEAATAEPPSTVAQVTFTDRQHAAARRAQQLAATPFGRNPLYYPEPEPAADEPASVPVPDPVDPERPTLRAIVVTSGVATALINGRWLRVGGVADGGWIVAAIDAHERSVTLRRADSGESISLFVHPMR
jgi:hypothetical protein